MKIGILTYHRSHNYGAMLQAVALRKIIRELGYQPYFVDYWPEHQKKRYKLFRWDYFSKRSFWGQLKYILMFLNTLYPKLLRRNNFETFFDDQIKPYCMPKESQFDVIVYGSDQIWRKQGDIYNPVYFGQNDFETSKHISYAASMGNLPIEQEDKNRIKNYLSCLDSISVRETDLRFFLQEQGFSNVVESIDPTLLLGQSEWDSFVKKEWHMSSPYLLFYEIQTDVFDRDEVKQFAKERGLKVIYLSGKANSYPTPSKCTSAGPYEFLSLIRSADFVITTSFHGLAFSIIFNKSFFVSFSSNSGRAKTLLDNLYLSEFLLAPNQKIPRKVPFINWEKVNESRKCLIQSSLSYLRIALKPE